MSAAIAIESRAENVVSWKIKNPLFTDSDFGEFHTFALRKLITCSSAEHASDEKEDEDQSNSDWVHGDEDLEVGDECFPVAAEEEYF